MSLVPSLLQAIVGIDGEALVMHVGDKPYVVAPTGQVDLATRGLTSDAVNGILAQLLPQQSQAALTELGAAQYELPALPEFPNELFTVVAARGGEDLWVEIRRRRVVDDADQIPAEFFEPAAPAAREPAAPATVRHPETPSPAAASAHAGSGDDLELPGADHFWPGAATGAEHQGTAPDATFFEPPQGEWSSADTYFDAGAESAAKQGSYFEVPPRVEPPSIATPPMSSVEPPTPVVDHLPEPAVEHARDTPPPSIEQKATEPTPAFSMEPLPTMIESPLPSEPLLAARELDRHAHEAWGTDRVRGLDQGERAESLRSVGSWQGLEEPRPFESQPAPVLPMTRPLARTETPSSNGDTASPPRRARRRCTSPPAADPQCG